VFLRRREQVELLHLAERARPAGVRADPGWPQLLQEQRPRGALRGQLGAGSVARNKTEGEV